MSSRPSPHSSERNGADIRLGVPVKIPKAVNAAWLPLAILALWQLAGSARWVDPLFLPAPASVASAGWLMLTEGDLLEKAAETLSVMFRGYLAGSLLGLAIGLVMGVSTFARRSLDPIISGLWSSPKLTWFPLLLIFFGLGDAPRLILIALGALIVLAIHTADAVRGINLGYVELAGNYGARRWDLFRKVYFPATLPQVFTGLRLALGRALTITVAMEMVTGEGGLGSIIWLAWQSFSTERLFVAVLLTAGLGTLFYGVLRLLEPYVVPWKATLNKG